MASFGFTQMSDFSVHRSNRSPVRLATLRKPPQPHERQKRGGPLHTSKSRSPVRDISPQARGERREIVSMYQQKYQSTNAGPRNLNPNPNPNAPRGRQRRALVDSSARPSNLHQPRADLGPVDVVDVRGAYRPDPVDVSALESLGEAYSRVDRLIEKQLRDAKREFGMTCYSDTEDDDSDDENMVARIRHLPEELLFHILSFLDTPQALCQASQVCQTWNEVAKDQALWKKMFKTQECCGEMDQKYDATVSIHMNHPGGADWRKAVKARHAFSEIQKKIHNSPHHNRNECGYCRRQLISDQSKRPVFMESLRKNMDSMRHRLLRAGNNPDALVSMVTDYRNIVHSVNDLQMVKGRQQIYQR